MNKIFDGPISDDGECTCHEVEVSENSTCLDCKNKYKECTCRHLPSQFHSHGKHQVTITFPTKDLMEEFCSYLSDGGGEYGFTEHAEEGTDLDKVTFNYSRCFPAWGWKEGEPKFIDVEIVEDDVD